MGSLPKPGNEMFGLYHPAEYILQRFGDWNASKRMVWPNGLPRDSQPQSLVDDFNALDERLNYYIVEARKAASK